MAITQAFLQPVFLKTRPASPLATPCRKKNTSNQLYNNPFSIISQQILRLIIYVDADGTTVTIKSGKGDIVVTFTGINVTATTSGKTCIITADTDVLQVDVAVDAASKRRQINLKLL